MTQLSHEVFQKTGGPTLNGGTAIRAVDFFLPHEDDRLKGGKPCLL
jgi:hypothetical protein